MYVGNPPFLHAEPTDLFYKLLVNKKYKLFWKIVSNKRIKGYFSEEFKDFIQKMLAEDPEERMTIEEVLEHPWMKGKMATNEEVIEEFSQRKK